MQLFPMVSCLFYWDVSFLKIYYTWFLFWTYRNLQTQLRIHSWFFIQQTLEPFNTCPTDNYLFKFNNRRNRARCLKCSKLKIKTSEWSHQYHSDVFMINFEHFSQLALVFLSSTCFSFSYYSKTDAGTLQHLRWSFLWH